MSMREISNGISFVMVDTVRNFLRIAAHKKAIKMLNGIQKKKSEKGTKKEPPSCLKKSTCFTASIQEARSKKKVLEITRKFAFNCTGHSSFILFFLLSVCFSLFFNFQPTLLQVTLWARTSRLVSLPALKSVSKRF